MGPVRRREDVDPRQLPHGFRSISTFLPGLEIFPKSAGPRGLPSTTRTTGVRRPAAELPALAPPNAKPSSLTQPAAFSTKSQSVIDPNMKMHRLVRVRPNSTAQIGPHNGHVEDRYRAGPALFGDH